jgi:hypothetical protein
MKPLNFIAFNGFPHFVHSRICPIFAIRFLKENTI